MWRERYALEFFIRFRSLVSLTHGMRHAHPAQLISECLIIDRLSCGKVVDVPFLAWSTNFAHFCSAFFYGKRNKSGRRDRLLLFYAWPRYRWLCDGVGQLYWFVDSGWRECDIPQIIHEQRRRRKKPTQQIHIHKFGMGAWDFRPIGFIPKSSVDDADHYAVSA